MDTNDNQPVSPAPEPESLTVLEQARAEGHAEGRRLGYAEGVLAAQLHLRAMPLTVTGHTSPEIQEMSATLPLRTPVKDLQFSVRVYFTLEREGITTIGDLLNHSVRSLLDFRNFNQECVDEVTDKLAGLGYTLQREAPDVALEEQAKKDVEDDKLETTQVD